jgi:hypothetical protein
MLHIEASRPQLPRFESHVCPSVIVDLELVTKSISSVTCEMTICGSIEGCCLIPLFDIQLNTVFLLMIYYVPNTDAVSRL